MRLEEHLKDNNPAFSRDREMQRSKSMLKSLQQQEKEEQEREARALRAENSDLRSEVNYKDFRVANLECDLEMERRKRERLEREEQARLGQMNYSHTIAAPGYIRMDNRKGVAANPEWTATTSWTSAALSGTASSAGGANYQLVSTTY